MFELLIDIREKAAQTTALEDLGSEPGAYVLRIINRPQKTDTEEGLSADLENIQGIAAGRPAILPLQFLYATAILGGRPNRAVASHL